MTRIDVNVTEINTVGGVKGLTSQCVDLMLQLVNYERAYVDVFEGRSQGYLRGVAQRIFQETHTGLVAKVGDQVVGLLMTCEEAPLHISSMIVHEAFRKQGIGRELVLRFKYRYLGESVSVKVYKENATAISFYQELGFDFEPIDDLNLMFGKTEAI